MGNARCEELNDILPPNGGKYDIIALGLQEATWGTPKDKNDSQDGDQLNSCYEQLTTDISSCLPQFDLVCIDSCRCCAYEFQVVHNIRVQMQQFIFVRKQLRNRVTNIAKIAENTGFLHVFPNKVRC